MKQVCKSYKNLNLDAHLRKGSWWYCKTSCTHITRSKIQSLDERKRKKWVVMGAFVNDVKQFCPKINLLSPPVTLKWKMGVLPTPSFRVSQRTPLSLLLLVLACCNLRMVPKATGSAGWFLHFMHPPILNDDINEKTCPIYYIVLDVLLNELVFKQSAMT